MSVLFQLEPQLKVFKHTPKVPLQTIIDRDGTLSIVEDLQAPESGLRIDRELRAGSLRGSACFGGGMVCDEQF